jgi:hypothetical protein
MTGFGAANMDTATKERSASQCLITLRPASFGVKEWEMDGKFDGNGWGSSFRFSD